jgi:hypothetical protein
MTTFDDGADPRKSPLVETEVEKDEEYEPEQFTALIEQRKREFNAQVRITAAQIAAEFPWNAAEPITDALIKNRFNVVYDWVMQDNKDLA